MDSRRQNARVGQSHGRDGSEVMEQQRGLADAACRAGPGSAHVEGPQKPPTPLFRVCPVCILHPVIEFQKYSSAFIQFPTWLPSLLFIVIQHHRIAIFRNPPPNLARPRQPTRVAYRWKRSQHQKERQARITGVRRLLEMA